MDINLLFPNLLALAVSQHYCVIDIETTGGDPRRDRITEIAIYRYDGEKIVDTFVSLVNPEVPIPEMITHLTGIDNEMVKDAPRFFEIAREVVEITENSIFVAHNAKFDYGFIQKEFRSLGYKFTRKILCTLNLSRKRMPGHRSYSLKNLCKRLKIENEAAHRAWGDARATLTLLQKLLSKEDEALDDIQLEIKAAKIPPNLPHKVVEDLPGTPGVYYFFNKEGRIIYTGKSNHIRKRIFSHFHASNKTKRGMRMFEEIHDISFEETGSELIALLLENEEIKRLQPKFNRAQRRTKFKYAIYAEENEQGYQTFWVGQLKENEKAVAYFSTQLQATGALKRRARDFELCPRLCNLEPGTGRCFHHQLHICRGACVGEEGPETYNERAEKMIIALNYGQTEDGSYMIVDEGRHEEERAVVCIEKGVYCGYTYLEIEGLNDSPENIRASIPYKPETPDVQRIIQGYLRRNEASLKFITFQ